MRHTETYAYQCAKCTLDNMEPLWDALNPVFKQAHAEGWDWAKLAARIRRVASRYVGYSDSETPPISRRSIQCWAVETAEDEVM